MTVFAFCDCVSAGTRPRWIVSFSATKRRFESCPVRQAESGRLLDGERLGGVTGEVTQVPRTSQLGKV